GYAFDDRSPFCWFPRSHSGQHTASGLQGHYSRREAVQDYWLSRRNPSEQFCGDKTVWGRNIFCKGKKDVVLTQHLHSCPGCLIDSSIEIWGNRSLGVHGVTVNEGDPLSSEILIAHPTGGRDMDEQIRAAAETLDLLPGTSKGTPSGIAIEPPVPQARFHEFDLPSQVLSIMAPIFHESGSLRIVAPFTRILDVPDIVAKPE